MDPLSGEFHEPGFDPLLLELREDLPVVHLLRGVASLERGLVQLKPRLEVRGGVRNGLGYRDQDELERAHVVIERGQ